MSAVPNQDNRNSALDQMKGVLIFLVVFGHLIELYFHHDSVLRPLWIAIYTMHMPMFILISGMVSKAELNSRQSIQLVKNVLAPLLAFELIYETTEYLLTGKTSVYAGLIAPLDALVSDESAELASDAALILAAALSLISCVTGGGCNGVFRAFRLSAELVANDDVFTVFHSRLAAGA
jgi:fucose 4-O-acetylase-like acetyltransferase